MLVRAVKLAVYLNLGRSRVCQMKSEGKIIYYCEALRLYDLERAIRDYDRNTHPGYALRHQADKLDKWGTYRP